jgi:hypothetical protein
MAGEETLAALVAQVEEVGQKCSQCVKDIEEKTGRRTCGFEVALRCLLGGDTDGATNTPDDVASRVPASPSKEERGRLVRRARSGLELAEQESSRGWGIVTTPLKDEAALPERISEWEYAGEPLVDGEDIFNDQLDLTLKSFADVKRLTEHIPLVARKFARLADQEQNRADIKRVLGNMKLVSAAAVEILESTVDAEDSVSGSKELEVAMNAICDHFKVVQRILPEATLELRCGPDLVPPELELAPSEGAPKSTSKPSFFAATKYDEFVKAAEEAYDDYDDTDGW